MAEPSSASKPAPADLVEELMMQGVAPDTYDFKPLDGLRKLIARRMTDSVQSAPHFTVRTKVEVGPLLALRETINHEAPLRVSVNDFLIKASALALMDLPQVNSTFTWKGVITHRHADVAFAVAMEGGLVTPIIRAAETKSPTQIATETRELAARGRVKRLKPEEYSGGSFSVSNLGMFGVAGFDAIINPPHSAILSLGAIEKAYVFDGDTPRVAQLVEAALTSDHRMIDGAVSAKWLQIFKGYVEKPQRLA